MDTMYPENRVDSTRWVKNIHVDEMFEWAASCCLKFVSERVGGFKRIQGIKGRQIKSRMILAEKFRSLVRGRFNPFS